MTQVTTTYAISMLTQMKSELKQRKPETNMSNRSAHFKCHFAKNSIKIQCQLNSAQINPAIPRSSLLHMSSKCLVPN